MRKPIIAANWKMNKTIGEVKEFLQGIEGKVPSLDKVESVIGSPDLFLQTIVENTADTEIRVAAENTFYEDSGAFTGETSPHALADLGVDYVIIGHSERRQIFNETNEIVNKKVKAVLKNSMTPIVCFGETLEQKNAGETESHLANQLSESLKDIDKADVANMVLAYEPIWAIGTGETASPEDANAAIKFIREQVKDTFGEDASQTVRIQYGGSVKPANIKDLMAQEHIDGALVGGASLEAESFIKLLEAID